MGLTGNKNIIQKRICHLCSIRVILVQIPYQKLNGSGSLIIINLNTRRSQAKIAVVSHCIDIDKYVIDSFIYSLGWSSFGFFSKRFLLRWSSHSERNVSKMHEPPDRLKPIGGCIHPAGRSQKCCIDCTSTDL